MKILVIGPGAFADVAAVYRTLNRLTDRFEIEMVVEAFLSPADGIAAGWARSRGVPVKFPYSDRKWASALEMADTVVAFGADTLTDTERQDVSGHRLITLQIGPNSWLSGFGSKHRGVIPTPSAGPAGGSVRTVTPPHRARPDDSTAASGDSLYE